MTMKTFVLSTLCIATTLPSLCFADFVKDRSVTLTARNFYLDRNFTEPNAAAPAAKQWVQGFILNAKSGFTEGTVGFGVDLYAGVGINLWGDKDYAPGVVGLSPLKDNGDPVDTWAEASLTAKAKISETEVKVGTLQPLNPVIVGSPARLLPQQYRGVAVESKDVDNIKIEAGYVNRVNHRNSTDWEKIRLSGANMKYKSVETDGLYYVGGYYYLRPETTFALYTANLVDVYDQYTFWVRNTHHFNERVNLFIDFRYFRTVESGAELAGEVDSHHGNMVLALGVDNHKFTTGYIHNSGDTGFPYLSGGEANTYIDAWATDFLNPNEKAWSVRYDYDFKNQVPGLKLMTRYTKGTDIKLENLKPGETLEERKFGIELSYQLQSTKLKGLFIRLRHEDYKNDFGPKATFQPAKEQRVNIDYTWKF
ncbi:outer membrane porin, OprD family [Acinetobacter cumulans]|uniref:Outer membrane porin, OprD family n=2 Tax=Acinetobacter cumulans TaxID=2136182 RepID=A0ABX9U2R7_9GAMM|nr:outer membrane porin, OprD family [Acinetobacter cumulans]